MTTQHILVVDDEIDTLNLVSLVLEGQGYQVSLAGSGREAVDIVRLDPPDLVVLDAMMPDMDGFEVARRLRELLLTSTVPIIMFTAMGKLEDRVRGYEAGINDYMTKPAHPAELLARIQSLLSREDAPPARTETSSGRLFTCFGEERKVIPFAINCAFSLSDASHDVILAELGHEQPRLAAVLGLEPPGALASLLYAPPEKSLLPLVEQALIEHRGLRVLCDKMEGKEALHPSPELAGRLLDAVFGLCDAVVLVPGDAQDAATRALTALSQDIVLVVGYSLSGVRVAERLIESLRDIQADDARLHVALVQQAGDSPGPALEDVRAALDVSHLMVFPARPGREMLARFNAFAADLWAQPGLDTGPASGDAGAREQR